MIAVSANSSGQRVASAVSLRMSVMVSKPISGRNRPKAIAAVMAASRSAAVMRLRSCGCARGLCAGVLAATATSHLFHVGAAEQALRQEVQRDRQHREGGDVLVVDRDVA